MKTRCPFKRMQSFVTVQPNETTSCVGCHEQRTQAPHSRNTPSSSKRCGAAPAGSSRTRTSPTSSTSRRDIQPILDHHCVKCHNHDRHDGEINLSGDHTPYYSTAYWTMFSKSLVVDGRNKYGNQPPPGHRYLRQPPDELPRRHPPTTQN